MTMKEALKPTLAKWIITLIIPNLIIFNYDGAYMPLWLGLIVQISKLQAIQLIGLVRVIIIILLMFLISYLVSCLIVGIYNKIRSK